jgi:hypothetical protein
MDGRNTCGHDGEIKASRLLVMTMAATRAAMTVN